MLDDLQFDVLMRMLEAIEALGQTPLDELELPT